MSDKFTRAELLANKLMNGTITPEEEIELNNWYSQNLDNEIDIPNGFVYSEEEHKSRILSAIKNHTHPEKQIRLWPRIVAAASIAIAIMAGGYFYYTSQLNKDNAELIAANDIAPGKNGATLTLANGKKILINDALAGNIASESGVRISKNKDGQIIYEVIRDDNDILTYNTLTTTRGEQTQVRLPDGTLVFLNSESSLRYPTRFAGSNKRVVSLEGEGFFDVSKDKSHPFIVKTADQEVEVLGTQFNINSYKDEQSVRTTLIEGSVKVTTANNMSKVLRPDQQATVSAKGITVEDVEAAFSVDWKEGFFMFDNETLESIMKRVSRWYSVKVVYEESALKNKKISGTVSKFENISAVIHALDKGKFADFRLHNGTLIINKRK